MIIERERLRKRLAFQLGLDWQVVGSRDNQSGINSQVWFLVWVNELTNWVTSEVCLL